jgi:intraflagellar transport protein 80
MELDQYPTDMDWVPGTKGVNDMFALGFADGSYKLITKVGKVEKHVTDAHKGAVKNILLFLPNSL